MTSAAEHNKCKNGQQLVFYIYIVQVLTSIVCDSILYLSYSNINLRDKKTALQIDGYGNRLSSGAQAGNIRKVYAASANAALADAMAALS